MAYDLSTPTAAEEAPQRLPDGPMGRPKQAPFWGGYL